MKYEFRRTMFSKMIFLLISWGSSVLINQIPESLETAVYYTLYILTALALTVVMYLISGWIMERKLSV
ncbi:MAG: hypothetical protein LUG93_15505 [Lachnospiraceae bacterium]|nr:hypothetical protein [Lachnospiraceae bacterium]